MEIKPPSVTLEVVEWLERLFPIRLAIPGDTLSDLMYEAGAASVARKVRSEFDKQHTTKVL